MLNNIFEYTNTLPHNDSNWFKCRTSELYMIMNKQHQIGQIKKANIMSAFSNESKSNEF